MDTIPNFPALNARNAFGYWFGAFLLGNIASFAAVIIVWRPESSDEPVPMRATTVSALALWAVFAGFLWMLSRGIGSGSMRHDFGLAAKWSDAAIGVPLGVACQLVLVNVVNYPLSRLFPGVFSSDDVERRARELADSASGAWVIALVIIVVIAAPVVEELVYRGLVQQGLGNSFGRRTAWMLAAVLFAGVHLQPVEFPGLLAFALVLGWCYVRTDRLGLCIATHMAFNATGLLLVATMN